MLALFEPVYHKEENPNGRLSEISTYQLVAHVNYKQTVDEKDIFDLSVHLGRVYWV